jgi:hypothetical protein
MANMLEVQTAQWRGMKRWLEEREEKRDVYNQDDLLWSKGMMDMVRRVMPTTEQGHRVKWKVDTVGVGLEASIHPDLLQTGGLEKTEERQ